MSRPRYSHCPPDQDFVMGGRGRLVPIHTPKLKDACKCGPCRQARLWTPEKRARAAARMAILGRLPRKAPSVACRWLPQHEQALASLLGTADTETIAERLTERFGYPRTETAVRQRIKKLGLSRLSVRPWSKRELWPLLGLTEDTLDRYIERGMISGTPWKLGGGKRKGNRSVAFTRGDAERFIREHPSCVEAPRIRDAGLRTLAVSLTRGRPTLTVPETARLTGMAYTRLMYWCRIGRIPSAHQIDGRFWRIAHEDVAVIRALSDQPAAAPARAGDGRRGS